MDLYVNPRASGVRIVQYVTLGAAILFGILGATEGMPGVAVGGLAIGAACLAGFEFLYIRTQVTRISQGPEGWTLRTLTTFGERTVRFEPAQARLGAEVARSTLYGDIHRSFVFFVAGRRYVLDATPPLQFDPAAFSRRLGA